MKLQILITKNSSYNLDTELHSFLEKIPTIFDNEGSILHNKRNVIKSFYYHTDNGSKKEVIVKRYKKTNFIQQIIYSFFRWSKAKRAFYNANELCNRNINTPQAIAYIETKKFGLLVNAYYITKRDYNIPIARKLIEQAHFDRQLALSFAYFVAQLHQKGILHNDLNSTNVLYQQDNNTHYTFSLIDINRMKFYPQDNTPNTEECLENLTRFTGRKDLFKYVIISYAESRGWHIDKTLNKALYIKEKHDVRWKRKKTFLRKLKLKRK